MRCFARAAWLKCLGQELAPPQATHVGSIILMQVENEYGYVGSDFMKAIRQQMRDAGFDLPLLHIQRIGTGMDHPLHAPGHLASD